jgi:phenylpropionate dioxygenase-like ring-hydroxylating dioxygenase large terminal subunit
MTYVQIFPEGPERTGFNLTLCLPESSKNMKKHREVLEGVWQTIEIVNDEDNKILESAHEGLTSAFAQAGRYSYLDKGVWQFHRYVLDRLAAAAR